MHAKTLFCAVLAAGHIVHALPAPAPDALSATLEEAPVGGPVAESMILPRKPEAEPEPQPHNDEAKQVSAACNATAAADGNQRRGLLMPRDPHAQNKASGGKACANVAANSTTTVNGTNNSTTTSKTKTAAQKKAAKKAKAAKKKAKAAAKAAKKKAAAAKKAAGN